MRPWGRFVALFEDAVQHPQLRYVPEEQDPSLTLETADLVVKVIDNTGLFSPESGDAACFDRYGARSPVPFTHHLGFHGLRTVYNRREQRNLVVPFTSWLGLRDVRLEGVENDPVDERASRAVGRGWPMRIRRRGRGAVPGRIRCAGVA